jgi:hypothetical protein
MKGMIYLFDRKEKSILGHVDRHWFELVAAVTSFGSAYLV